MRKLIAKVGLATVLMVGTPLVTNSASATTILYDDLSGVSAGADPAASSYGPLYDSFSTGNSALNFDSLKLLLDASNPNDNGTFTVTLLSGAPGLPGVFIGSADPQPDSSLTTSLSVVSFTPSILLTANTRYWIELSSTGSVNWSWTRDVSGTGVANEFLSNNSKVYPVSSQNGVYQMQISATPLPSTWTMLIAGFVGLGFLAYRGTNKKSAVIGIA